MFDWFLFGGGGTPPFFGDLPPGFSDPGVSGSTNPSSAPPAILPLPTAGDPLVPRDPTADQRLRRFTEIVSEFSNSLMIGGYLVRLANNRWRIGPGTYVESRDPTTSDDLTSGVLVGDFWLNVETGTVWFATGVETDMATWITFGGSGAGLTGTFDSPGVYP